MTYLLGRWLRSHNVGILAGAYLATSYWFIFAASTYYSHIATTFLCLAASLVLVSVERHPSLPLIPSGLACGFLLGFSVATRPLTGLSAGLSLVLWIMMRKHIAIRRLALLTLAIAAGSLLPASYLFYYNLRTTGSPWRVGYQAANGALHNLGFGPRGMIVYGGDAPHELAELFTPRLAALHFFETLRRVSLEFTPLFLIAPMSFLAALYGLKYNYKAWLAFVVLPSVQFFYYYSGPRFYSELLPFLMVGSAVFISDLRAKGTRGVGTYVGAIFILGNILIGGLGLYRDARVLHSNYKPYFKAVEALREEYGKVVVFVRDGPDVEYRLEALWWLNAAGISGTTVIARDRGTANEALMRHYPHYCPFSVSAETIDDVGQRVQAVPLSANCGADDRK